MKSLLSHILFLILLFSTFLSSCTPPHEVQETLRIADSLRTEGIAYTDSVSLAGACMTTGTLWTRNIHPTDYAKANYYYGRLLRERGNQVEAMQCFINASHADPSTPIGKRIGSKYRHMTVDDFNLLGRVYSNIGTLCHLADEFQLSAEMYELCAEQFKKANNTTAYYYALNNIAFELAAQKDTIKTYTLLNRLRLESSDNAIIAKSWETESFLCRNIGQYEKAISAVLVSQQLGNHEATGYIIKAQSFWYIEKYDSAVYWANYVLNNLALSDYNKSNMLYILAYNDTTKGVEQVKQITEERTDLQIDNIMPQKQQLAIAVEKLRQSFNNTRYYIFVILILLSCAIIFITVYYVIKYINRKHRLSIQSINQEKEQLIQTIMQRQENLHRQTLEEEQKQAVLQSAQYVLTKQIDELKQQSILQHNQLLNKIDWQCETIRRSQSWQEEIIWKDYHKMSKYIDRCFGNLSYKLVNIYKLNETEMRLCILALIDVKLSNEQIADLLCYARTGIGTLKYRVSKKLGTNTAHLREFLLENVILGVV